MSNSLNTSLIKPAKLDLADHIGRKLATAKGESLETARRIYSNMTPQAKARADIAASWAIVEA